MREGVIVALPVALFISALAFPFFIRHLRIRQYGQQIREDGPANHTAKAGTVTMGGVVFVVVTIIVCLTVEGFSPMILAALFLLFGCGLIGFTDDYLKVVRKQSLGLKARSKLAGEIAVALFFVAILVMIGHYSSEIWVPLFNIEVDFGFLYPLLVIFLVIASTNAVNLTDGVDGLAAGTSIIALAAYACIAFSIGAGSLILFDAALIGALAGFLIYNRYPARVFMGDTGSLALGGSFAALAVLTKTELLLAIIGGVFVIETLAVMAQVLSFRLTGHRILRMAPLHHHYELKGWSEWRVVIVFWGIAVLMALGGVLIFNFRLA
ncbi:MAG: phospho-N-acetylmuramoyl-pentapeptide-transferase [Firmicutes bacterium ML8_F2]|jgi:phospho-N-acetylmuramoyl-pentapeptide-transferase|nr:MAG: phospho-N-acetylmuramoyl-pentapeptide-transferase [Firmicutes bacterium ML8_F2]